MTIVQYDGSFEGLLSAIFEVYEYKIKQASIAVEEGTYSLFGSLHRVQTDTTKAERVLKTLEQKLSKTALSQLHKTFLSELPAMENHILHYVQYVISSRKPVENDYSHPDVLFLQQTSRKVHREKHRMEAFVRFSLTKDGLYYSIIQPDFNVLPLIAKHFKDRYADQCWLIYDTRRKYGLYYDKNEVSEVQMEFAANMQDKEQLLTLHHEQEELYQRLWQQYFSSVNIAARKNMKLHIRHMPKRYWRFLTEKKPAIRLADDHGRPMQL